MQFAECDQCRAKPGSPPLCAGCLNNRTVIGRYEEFMQEIMEATDAPPSLRLLAKYHLSDRWQFTRD